MVERTTTPPPLHAPTAKEKKYDRQLRLWAASGQAALEEAKVLLLNSGPGVAGVETLKNLILPGIGSFTIVDDTVVGEKDLGLNFFLGEDSLGRPRADECCRYLSELNPEVSGHSVHKSIEAFCQDTSILDTYSLILLAGPPKDSSLLEAISRQAEKSSIPLFYFHCVGFYSHFSIQLPAQFPIVDTHPDPASTQDLRLLNPWTELLEFVQRKTSNLDSLQDHDHGHIPYLLLLIHYLGVWRSSHNNNPPANYSEKKEFKALVESGARRNNAEGGEENFDEAAAAVLKSLNPPSIPSGLREVFEAEDCKTLTRTSANFWVIGHAISDFHNNRGVLPLPGALPDMKAQSVDYIHLQNIYKAKARKDLAEVTHTIRRSEQSLGRAFAIDEKEIEAFCKGAAFVKLIHGRPIRIARQSPTSIEWSDRLKPLKQELEDPTSLLPIYFAFLALDSIQDQQTTKTQPDFPKRANQSVSLNAIFPAAPPASEEAFDDVVKEIERADGAELHNIAAVTGGMVAQEVIKVITKQYVPVDNACVFDGIASKTAVFNI